MIKIATAADKKEFSERSKQIAEDTWKKGFIHLTVDGYGLVSLWDHEMPVTSYVKLELTPEQQKIIQETMDKGGYTP